LVREKTETGRRVIVITAYALLLGAYESLKVLADGHAADSSYGIVLGALAAAAVGLVVPAVIGPTSQNQSGS
jgi:hypothetical protein